MVMGVSSYPGKGRRRRRVLRKSKTSRGPKERNRTLPLRGFFSWLTLPRLTVPRLLPIREQGKEPRPEGSGWERFIVGLLGIAGWVWKWPRRRSPELFGNHRGWEFTVGGAPMRFRPAGPGRFLRLSGLKDNYIGGFTPETPLSEGQLSAVLKCSAFFF